MWSATLSNAMYRTALHCTALHYHAMLYIYDTVICCAIYMGEKYMKMNHKPHRERCRVPQKGGEERKGKEKEGRREETREKEREGIR